MIEAARAGEQGSAIAAKEIKGLITESMDRVGAAVAISKLGHHAGQ